MRISKEKLICASVPSFSSVVGSFNFNTGRLVAVITHPETGLSVSISGSPAFVAKNLDEYSEMWKVANFDASSLENVLPEKAPEEEFTGGGASGDWK